MDRTLVMMALSIAGLCCGKNECEVAALQSRIRYNKIIWEARHLQLAVAHIPPHSSSESRRLTFWHHRLQRHTDSYPMSTVWMPIAINMDNLGHRKNRPLSLVAGRAVRETGRRQQVGTEPSLRSSWIEVSGAVHVLANCLCRQ